MQESIQRFGSARAISRVIDAMVGEASMTKRKEAERKLTKILHAKKIAKVTQKELEEDRHKLSLEFENRGL